MARPSILGLAALTTTVAQVVTAATSSYTLEDTFDSSNFFDSFTWFTDADPTAGFVSYQDQSSATSAGLATIANNQVRLGVDSTSTVDSSTLSAYVGGDTSVGGRKSVRLQSKKTYTKMLMVADIEHMPVGCGTWPALWTWGTGSWPADGEIDIIEGANSQTTNAMTLHTSAGCTPSNSGQDPGTSWYDGSTGDCSADSGSTGCPQRGTSTSNFGAGFNSAQGGVYAMEWTDAAISIWFWPRSSIPSGISSSSTVDTGSLGTPLARFEGGSGCDIASHFQGHVITINTALCGQWAGKAWAADGTCASQADSCAAWVANNPGAFADAYWLFNSIKVYTAGASSTNSSSTAASTKRDPVMDFRIGTTVAGSGGAGGGGRGGEEAPWEAGRGGTQQTADSTLVADMGQKRGLSEVFDGVKDVWDDAKNDGKNAWDTAKNSIGGSSTDENEDRDQDEMASTTSDARPLRESVSTGQPSAATATGDNAPIASATRLASDANMTASSGGIYDSPTSGRSGFEDQDSARVIPSASTSVPLSSAVRKRYSFRQLAARAAAAAAPEGGRGLWKTAGSATVDGRGQKAYGRSTGCSRRTEDRKGVVCERRSVSGKLARVFVG